MTPYVTDGGATKVCVKCHADKPVSQFQRRSGAKDGLQRRCAACCNADKYAWYYRNKEQASDSSRAWQLKNKSKCRAYAIKSKYGVGVDVIDALLEKQGKACAICLSRFDLNGRGMGFDVDHNHATGLVRGLLCRNCNTGLGRFADSKEMLGRAIEYLG